MILHSVSLNIEPQFYVTIFAKLYTYSKTVPLPPCKWPMF